MSVSQKCTNPGYLVVQGTIFRTVATNIFRLTIAAVLTYKNMLSIHMHQEEIVKHKRDLSQESVVKSLKNLKRHYTKFSLQDDLAPIRKAEKDSTANLQQPHQPAQYLPFASVIFSSRNLKEFLTQIHTHERAHKKSPVNCSNFKFNHYMSLLLRINVVWAIKSSRMRWSDHVAHTREKIHAEFRLGNLMERYHFEI